MIYDVAIVGGGVIGGMVARELTKYDLSLCILEKENDVACGASKANSGIVHGGYDPEPGTLKAKMNTLGVEKLFAVAKQLHVPMVRNGSMVCAFNAEEDETIKELYARGLVNNTPDMQILTGDQAREIEPNLSKAITSVLWVRNAGIVCPYDLTIAAVGNAMDNGAKLLLNFELVKVEKANGLFRLTSAAGETVTARYLINCAGCGCDKVAKLCGDDSFTIIPRGGEYLLLDKTEGQRVSHTIFQCPSKEGKGILVSPTVDGNLLTGPTAGVVADPEEKAITQSGIDTVIKLSAKSVPSVEFRNVITSFTGVRSSEKNGDFIIGFSEKTENLLNVAAIDSPGLTSCVAIAEHVVEILKNAGVELPGNKLWNGSREDPHAFRKMSDEAKDAYIKEHPEYGKIVCRCEGVSEGEIRYALRVNPPARDMDGVKRRTRSGMGRCQGGFCGPYVMKLIAEERGIPKEAVTKKGKGSKMVMGKR